MSAKIQAFEKLIKADHRDIQTQSEELKREPISALHCKVRGEQPKVFKQLILIYLVTLQELPNDKGSVRANWTPVSTLDLWGFKSHMACIHYL